MIDVSFAREYIYEATDVLRSEIYMSCSNVAWQTHITWHSHNFKQCINRCTNSIIGQSSADQYLTAELAGNLWTIRHLKGNTVIKAIKCKLHQICIAHIRQTLFHTYGRHCIEQDMVSYILWLIQLEVSTSDNSGTLHANYGNNDT